VSALWNLERIRRRQILFRGDPCLLSFLVTNGGPLVPAMGGILSVSHCAACFSLHQYFTSSIRPSFVDEGLDLGGLVLAMILRFADGYGGANSTGLDQTLRWVFQQGCCPNQTALMDTGFKFMDPFLTLCLETSSLDHLDIADAMQIFLEFGAYRDVSLSDYRGDKVFVDGLRPVETKKMHTTFPFG
jgi:hypothetical protein